MASVASRLLRQLERHKARYGFQAERTKLELLRSFERRRLARAREVYRLHEVLCFLRAYPDGPEVLAVVERLLSAFAGRSDLRRHREALADTGIAGTIIHYRFYWVMAQWLASRWPNRIVVDWEEFRNPERLEKLLYLLVPYFESPALDELDLSVREWIARLKGPRETDAEFLIRRFQALRMDEFGREMLFEDVDPPLRLLPGRDTPSRTRAWHETGPVVFQRHRLATARPSMHEAVDVPPVAVRPVSRREGRALIDLAREAMVTRSRDLDAFASADENDVRLVDFGDGLQFACMGAIPERRLMFESVYGFLTLKNGVPIGYVLASALLRSSEIAYNVFETYRGAEASFVLGRVLSMVHHLFGSRAFSIDPYQLGHGNSEGLHSGAWWFYYKLGFRPEDPGVRRVLRAELKHMEDDPRHRSTIATLEKLAAAPVFLYLGRYRDDIMGKVSLGNLGLRVSQYVAERFGGDRERAVRVCAREAARLLELRSTAGLSRGERLAWDRWSPVVMALGGVKRWPREDRRALARVVRAKGGRRESEYVRAFDAHRRLSRVVVKLARGRSG